MLGPRHHPTRNQEGRRVAVVLCSLRSCISLHTTDLHTSVTRGDSSCTPLHTVTTSVRWPPCAHPSRAVPTPLCCLQPARRQWHAHNTVHGAVPRRGDQHTQQRWPSKSYVCILFFPTLVAHPWWLCGLGARSSWSPVVPGSSRMSPVPPTWHVGSISRASSALSPLVALPGGCACTRFRYQR